MARATLSTALLLAAFALSGCGDARNPARAGGTGGAIAQPSGGIGGAVASGTGGMAGSATGGASGAAGAAAVPAGAGGMMSGGTGGMMAGTGGKNDADAATGEPDASVTTAPCDRACLVELNTAYLDALIARDAPRLPLAPSARFTENGEELALTEGLWAVASTLGAYRQDFAEVAAGQTALFAALEDDVGEVLLAARLAVIDRQVTELETIVARRGEATFFSPSGMTHDAIYDTDVSPSDGSTREALIAIASSYFDGLEAGDGSDVPFDSGASRNENGVVTASGPSISNLSAFSYIDTIKRRFVLVDEERGVVLPFALFEIPNGLTGSRTLHIAELFKVEAGDIMRIHAVMVNRPFGTDSGWE